MGEVIKTNLTPFNEQRLRQEYACGKGSKDGQLLIGIEIESWFMNAKAARSEAIRMMSPAESQTVLKQIASSNPESRLSYEINGQRIPAQTEDAPLVCVDSQSVSYQLELCGVLEAATAPVMADAPQRLLGLIENAQQTMQSAANITGLLYYDGAIPGSIKISDCSANLVKRERLQAEWAKFSSEGSNSPGLRTMGLAASVQASISYRDPQEAGEIIMLGNLLAPAFYAAFSNTTGFLEGATATLQIPRADWWMQHNRTAPRAGIPAPILKQMFVPNAEARLLDTWIDYARQVPMVYYWDEAGQPRFETSPSFNQLAARGLGTMQNFALAESLLWPDVKVIGGQRIELRAADSGSYQPAALAIMAAEIFAIPENRRKAIQEILAASQITADTLQFSRERVGTMGMSAPYGKARVAEIVGLMADWIRNASSVDPAYGTRLADRMGMTARPPAINRTSRARITATRADLLRVQGLLS